jgi:hypothetical protein
MSRITSPSFSDKAFIKKYRENQLLPTAYLNNAIQLPYDIFTQQFVLNQDNEWEPFTWFIILGKTKLIIKYDSQTQLGLVYTLPSVNLSIKKLKELNDALTR